MGVRGSGVFIVPLACRSLEPGGRLGVGVAGSSKCSIPLACGPLMGVLVAGLPVGCCWDGVLVMGAMVGVADPHDVLTAGDGCGVAATSPGDECGMPPGWELLSGRHTVVLPASKE